jgi:hypothetical protein
VYKIRPVFLVLLVALGGMAGTSLLLPKIVGSEIKATQSAPAAVSDVGRPRKEEYYR